MVVELSGDGQFITDKKLLKNILINLLSNAVKFSPDDGRIVMTANNSNNQMVISVKDQGIGISEEDQQHLFTSFYRGTNAINIQGTGLGLHIVKGYIELLQGNIELQSELGAGTVITIEIPLLHL